MTQEVPPAWLQVAEKEILLFVYASPGAKKSALVGEYDGRLKIRLAAKPEYGKANKELCTFIASLLAVPQRNVSLVKGATSRVKTLSLSGVTVESLLTAFVVSE